MKKLAFFFDVLAVLIFVAIGRHAHNHGVTWKGMVSTTWPFATGLVGGWIFLKFSDQTGLSKRDGFILVLFTVAIGMVLRVIAGQGTAFTFILVALTFLSLFLVGWRWIYQRIRLTKK